MWASVSVSSGPMCTNCDEVQHAVQPLHGTSAARSPRIALRVSIIHDEKSPASNSGSSLDASSAMNRSSITANAGGQL